MDKRTHTIQALITEEEYVTLKRMQFWANVKGLEEGKSLSGFVRHLLQKDDQTEELKDLILGQMKFKKESHYLELGETGLTKNLSKTGG